MSYEKPRESREVLVIPSFDGWKVRICIARLPFYLDSKCYYRNRADAVAEAEKWENRKITVTVKESEDE